MKFFRLAATLGLTFSLATAAGAGDTQFSFGETAVTVRADDSLCALNSSQAFDKAWLAVQIRANANNNEVAGAYLPCDELAQMRQGVNLTPSRWVILLSPLQGGAKAAPIRGVTRKQLVEALAAEFDKGVKVDVAEISKSVNQAANEVLGTDKMQPIEISSNGAPSLLAKTDTGVYAGMKLRIGTAAEQEPIGAVVGMTLINDHMLSVNVYQPFDDPKTINTLLGQAHEIIDGIVALND